MYQQGICRCWSFGARGGRGACETGADLFLETVNAYYGQTAQWWQRVRWADVDHEGNVGNARLGDSHVAASAGTAGIGVAVAAAAAAAAAAAVAAVLHWPLGSLAVAAVVM